VKIYPVGAVLFHADGQTDSHDEAFTILLKLLAAVLMLVTHQRKPTVSETNEPDKPSCKPHTNTDVV
jgi:hypothetical protein